ncbi:MAG: M48 family metalloprotease [Clostridia bacterium]|nr:M48 family metalloprotease [Clostridia bacterium]
MFVLLLLFGPVFIIEGALLTLVLTGAALDAAAFTVAGLTLAIWVAARYVAMTRVPAGAVRDDGFQPLADQVADGLGAPRRPVYRVPGRQANAWALPAAVVITAGLAEQDVRVVRGVLAHEFAHVMLRHPQLYGLAAAVFGASHGLAGHLEAAAEADFKRRRGSPAVAGGLFGFGAGFHRGVAAIGAWMAGPWLKGAELDADLLAAGRFGGDLELALCQVAGPGFGPTGLWEGFVPFHPSVQERLDAIRAVVARQKKEEAPEREASGPPTAGAEAEPPAAETEAGLQEREPEVQFDPAFLCPVAAAAAQRVRGVAAA